MKIIMAEEFNNQLYVRADVIQLHIKEAIEAEREAIIRLIDEMRHIDRDGVIDAIRARGQA